MNGHGTPCWRLLHKGFAMAMITRLRSGVYYLWMDWSIGNLFTPQCPSESVIFKLYVITIFLCKPHPIKKGFFETWYMMTSVFFLWNESQIFKEDKCCWESDLGCANLKFLLWGRAWIIKRKKILFEDGTEIDRL